MAAAMQRCAVVALLATLASGIMTFSQAGEAPASASVAFPTHRHVIVMPKEKLAFCFVQKVASEHFAQVFNAANNMTASFDPVHSTPYRLGVNYQQVTRRNGWRFAMFVRDPLERYLSAFLAKCVPTGANTHPANGGKFCYGPTRSAPVTLEETIALFEAHLKNNVKNGLPFDDHWQSQYTVMKLHCGADRFDPDKLDFTGRMTYDVIEVNRQVQEMLALTSLPDPAGLATRFFPLPKTPLSLVQCPTQHCTKSHAEMDRFYRKPETVQAVMELYKDDYEHYGFKPHEFTSH